VRFIPSFLLLSALTWGQTCVPVSILRPADSLTGSLSDADCRLSDGSIAAEYILTLPTVGQLQLNAASADFEITLFVRDSAGRKLESGAAIQSVIERGEYTVVVNAQKPGQLGKFTLSSAFTPEPGTMCRALTRIGIGQTISGHLLDTSCRQFNDAPFDGYKVTLFGAGTLDVSLVSANFSCVLTLRDDDGHALTSGALSISAPVLGGTDYSIVVAGSDAPARGDYSLTLKFTPAEDETCRSLKVLRSSEDIKGSIGDSSCSFGASQFNYYDLNVTEAGFADFRVLPSGDMTTLVAVLDRSGRLVSQDLESGGSNKPILRQQLSPGSYTLLVITAGSGGDYTLQYRFNPGPPAICPALELRPSADQTGSLAGVSSCHFFNGMQDVYTFSTPSAGTLDITMSSSDFRGTILLRDAKDNHLVRSDATDLQDAHIVANLAAGAYSLSTVSIDPGAYTIRYNFTPRDPAACPAAQPVAVNSGLPGVLGERSCLGADGQPVDTYEFATPAAGMAALFLTSTDLNSYLTLTDSQGSILRRDDDSYGAPDAMILQWLPAGTYRAKASASGGGQTGRYRLDVLSVPGDRPPGCQPKGDLGPGTTQSSLYITSCQYVDDTFADIYRLTVAEAKDLDISLSSKSFDGDLELLDSQGNVIDQDGGGDASARLTTSVEAGVYYVVAKPFVDQGYAVGVYVMIVK
jgi:hypothetical protein